jgi:hypothetical protein
MACLQAPQVCAQDFSYAADGRQKEKNLLLTVLFTLCRRCAAHDRKGKQQTGHKRNRQCDE